MLLPGNRGNPPRFFGVVSAAPGGVETAFERCRLPFKAFSLLRSHFRVPRGALRRLLRVAGFRGNPSRFSEIVSSDPGALKRLLRGAGYRGKRSCFSPLPLSPLLSLSPLSATEITFKLLRSFIYFSSAATSTAILLSAVEQPGQRSTTSEASLFVQHPSAAVLTLVHLRLATLLVVHS